MAFVVSELAVDVLWATQCSQGCLSAQRYSAKCMYAYTIIQARLQLHNLYKCQKYA